MASNLNKSCDQLSSFFLIMPYLNFEKSCTIRGSVKYVSSDVRIRYHPMSNDLDLSLSHQKESKFWTTPVF